MPNNKYTHKIHIIDFFRIGLVLNIEITQEEFLYLKKHLRCGDLDSNAELTIKHINSQNVVFEERYLMKDDDNPHLELKELITQLLMQYAKQ